MDTNRKNRKLLWLCGAALVILYFAPSALQSFRQAGLLRQQQREREAAQAKQKVPAPAPADAPSAAQLAQIGNLTGIWSGQQAQANRDICQLALELRNPAAAQVTGYAKLVCYPLPSYSPGQPKVNPGEAFLKAFTPLEAVLSGSPDSNGGVAFHIDKTIGTSVEGCALTTFTVTPFGNDQIAVDWQKGNCAAGQMTLQRMRK